MSWPTYHNSGRVRKFFCNLGITAPITLRYQNFSKKYKALSFEEFVAFDDSINFRLGTGSGSEIDNVLSSADNVITNSGALSSFEAYLSKLDFLHEEILRPKWDTYFMHVATLVSKRSTCFRRAVGAVLTQNNRIIATGYNGAPFGIDNCNKGGCPRCVGAAPVGKELEKCICIHAEENAVIEAGFALARGATIYTTTFPCLLCAKAIIQVGISRIVYFKEYHSELAEKLFKDAGLKVDQLSPFVVGPYLKV